MQLQKKKMLPCFNEYIEKLILKFVWKSIGTWIDKTTLKKKEQSWKASITWFQDIVQLQCGVSTEHKYKQIDQRSRIESIEIDPQI